jgi:hypothetical protein
MTCAPITEMSNSRSPSGAWQLAQLSSLNCGMGWPSPAASQLMRSWHEPQESRLGSVNHTEPPGVSAVWQRTQLRTSWVNTTSE